METHTVQQGEDLTEEASFCQQVDGGWILDLAVTCLCDNIFWQLWHSIDKQLQKSWQYTHLKKYRDAFLLPNVQ